MSTPIVPTRTEFGMDRPVPKPKPAVAKAPLKAFNSQRSATKPLSERFTTKPIVRPMSRFDNRTEQDDEDDLWMEVEIGDMLTHPQLGVCEVVGDDDSGGTKIRLTSGKTRVLHLEALEVLKPTKGADGKRMFKLAGPKKKRR